MPGLTLTLEEGDSALISVPLEGGDELVEVTCVRATEGRVSLAIVAPRDFPIGRWSATAEGGPGFSRKIKKV